jgi:lysophospholipase L1-like esterase
LEEEYNVMGTSRRFRVLPSLVVLALIVTSTLAVLNWIRWSSVEEAATTAARPVINSYQQAPMQRPLRQSALFVGDDFTVWGQGYYTYPDMVCDEFALNCNIDAQAGTGFVSNGEDHSSDNRPLIGRLDKDRRIYDANLIIIDAGRNDLQAGAAPFNGALEQYLTAVRQFWPEAKIVVIVPWLISDQQYPNYAEIASVVRQQTERVGGVTIDPVEEGWFNDVDISKVGTPYNFHPNQAGHTWIGKKLSESLRLHGLMERGAMTQ